MKAMDRRDFLRGAAGAVGFLALPGLHGRKGAAAHGAVLRERGADLDVALRAERWIRSARVRTPAGIAWPADPAHPGSVGYDLYSGTPGIILFYLELHEATGDPAFLAEARSGADDLAANLEEPGGPAAGLYTGVAGRAFTLGEVARVTGEARYHDAARRGVALLEGTARSAGAGVEWNPASDIVSGGAGVLLYLLHAARTLDHPAALELAARAGRRLIELGQPAEAGTKWALSPTVANEYPNFSHGAAGVAYALATLHEATGERAHLEAALAGAEYLESIAAQGDGCRVFHHRPGGEDLYYLSWCHGGPGTVRLFERLRRATGDARWSDAVDCHTRGITALGAPVERSPGYWNNISQCCGNAGVGEFFLDLHRHRPGRGYIDVARRAADDARSRATREGEGMKWVQAEHRVQPDLLVAQTGRMQGAAGVGSFFVHLESATQGGPVGIALPDSPW